MNNLFKEFFIFTDAGLCLYSWKSAIISESTDSSLISGLLFAVSEFTREAFRGRLQRLDLDNSKLIMTSQEFLLPVPEKENQNKNANLIFGALVDTHDDNHLIQRMLTKIGKEIISHYDRSGIKPMDKDTIDPIVNDLLKSKTYSRNNYMTSLGIIIAILGIFVGSTVNTFRWELFVPASYVSFLDIIPVLVTSFGIVFIGGILIGEKNKAVKLIVLSNAIFGTIIFILFQNYLSKLSYLSDIGSFYTFIVFVLLISFTSSLFGSLFTEKRFLFPDESNTPQ